MDAEACVYTRRHFVYTAAVTKHLVDIDPDLLEQARAAAGTETIRATVEAGLRQLANVELAVKHVRRLRKGGLDLAKLEAARTPRMTRRG